MASRNDADVPPNPPLSVLFDARFVYWCALLMLGFAYVAMILCWRASPSESGGNAWADWLAVALSAPALYLLAVRHMLYATEQGFARVLLWNGLAYGGVFFAALHWEWVGRLTHANFSLTADQLSHLNLPSRIACAIGVVLATIITAVCLRSARHEGILVPYLLWFAGLVCVLVGVTCAYGPGYHVHVHHYFLALCLLPFVRFRNWLCLIAQAALAGVYVEGACRWGMAPIWVPGR